MANLRVLNATRVRSAVSFTDFAGNAADPPLGVKVTIKGTSTNGTVTETDYVYGVDAEVVKDAVGFYHIDFLAQLTVDNLTTWWAVWTGTDFVVGQSFCTVSPSQI